MSDSRLSRARRLAAASIAASLSALSGLAAAQSVDNTGTLPDAKPGQCYAKVITPARFATRSEVVVVQEGSERIESIPAEFEQVEERVAVRESSTIIEVSPTVFETTTEQVRVRPAEREWSEGEGRAQRPASPETIAAIGDAGVVIDEVEPGSCYLEYWSEPTYRTELQRVLVKERGTTIEVTPAVYETVQERIVVKEASTEIVDVPAVFRTEEQSVLVEPARSVWKPGRGPVERIDDTTGEILCLVEIPARYETVTRTVLESAASSRTVTVPAVYETVEVEKLVSPASERRVESEPEYTTVETRRRASDATFAWALEGAEPPTGSRASGRKVCLIERPAEYDSVQREVVATPASTTVTAVPAEYRTFTVQKLVAPASERRSVVPEQTETITRQVEIEPSRLEWRPVLCETNMTRDIVSSLQLALAREGHDPGPPDGLVGAGTMRAIEAFQVAEGLDRGGITYESLEALGVDVP